MSGLYGVAREAPQTDLAAVASRMGSMLAHVPGQTPHVAGGDGWQGGAVCSSSGAGALLLRLSNNCIALVAGTPVVRRGTLAGALEALASRLQSIDSVGAWFDIIDGCFAFVLIDPVSRRLLLANDRYGAIPIYLGVHKGTFYWASEVKAIAAEMAGEADLCGESLQHFLSKGFIEPPRTYYRSIRQIEERTALLLDLPTATTQKIGIFRPRPIEVPSDISFANAKDQFKEQLTTAIASRLALSGNDDIVVTLSGGLDSRILLAEAARMGNVRAVTYGQPMSPEVRLAAQVASIAKVPHQIIPINETNWLKDRDLAVWMTDGMIDLDHTHIIHVTAALRKAGIVLDGLFGDWTLGRGYTPVDPTLGIEGNRFLRLNRFTCFGPRIEQNFVPVGAPLIDADLVAFMDALPAAYTDDSRLYCEASGERHGALYSKIAWHKTGRPPYPYRRSGWARRRSKLVGRIAQASRWMGLPFGARYFTMDYFGWYRRPEFSTALERLVYGGDAMLKDFADVPRLESLMSRMPSPSRARLPSRLLTAEVWLRQQRTGRALRWEEMMG
jgi:hypothetical protein